MLDVADAASRGDVVMILLPDEKQAEIWEAEIADGIAAGNLLLFAHGFAIHFDQIEPPPGVDVGMVAPKGPGHLVRRQFEEGQRRALPDGRPPGRDRRRPRPRPRLRRGDRRRPRRRSSRRPSRTRARPTSSASRPSSAAAPRELVRAGFETLVEAGYDPRLAYFECLHELKLIVDLMYEKGIQGMRYSISNTAEYGDMTRGKRVITEETRAAMKKILADIQSGEFAKEWIAENRAGGENFERMREEGAAHPVEKVGKELREMMPWIDQKF